jgi:hypothetical protein
MRYPPQIQLPGLVENPQRQDVATVPMTVQAHGPIVSERFPSLVRPSVVAFALGDRPLAYALEAQKSHEEHNLHS